MDKLVIRALTIAVTLAIGCSNDTRYPDAELRDAAGPIESEGKGFGPIERDSGPRRPGSGERLSLDAGAEQAGSGAAGTGSMLTAGAAGADTGQPIAGSGGSSPQAGSSAPVDDRCESGSPVPVVLLVVDGSGSMCDAFGGTTRWQALRAALLEPANGVVYEMQSEVLFGAMVYDAAISPITAVTATGGSPLPQCAERYTEQKLMGECPQVIQVSPALDNAAALDAAFPATELGGSTPTHTAMKSAVDLMLGMVSTNPDAVNSPLYIILATDGTPNDICTGGLGGDSSVQQQQVIAEVDRAAAADITTFAINMAGNDAILQAHLEEVADHGQPNNPDAYARRPADFAELRADIRSSILLAKECAP